MDNTTIQLAPTEIFKSPRFGFGESVWVRGKENLGTALIYGILYQDSPDFGGWWYMVKYTKEVGLVYEPEKFIYPVKRVFL